MNRKLAVQFNTISLNFSTCMCNINKCTDALSKHSHIIIMIYLSIRADCLLSHLTSCTTIYLSKNHSQICTVLIMFLMKSIETPLFQQNCEPNLQDSSFRGFLFYFSLLNPFKRALNNRIYECMFHKI